MSRQVKISRLLHPQIASEYTDGYNTVELGHKYHVNPASIAYILRRQNVKLRSPSESHRKYLLRENYFNEIDTAEKAYFVGLLYADGCNSTERNCIRLILTEGDKELLERLSRLVFISDKPLTFRKGKTFVSKGKTYLRHNSYCLTIQNAHISRRLYGLGIVKAKSLIVTFPNWLNPTLLSHFVRGYFDGDGSIGITKDNQIAISILGTEHFCRSLNSILNMIGIKSSICHAKKKSKLKQLTIHGNTGGRRFMDWIYEEPMPICLNRKLIKYQKILERLPQIRPVTCSLCQNKHYSQGFCKQHHYQIIGKKARHARYLAKKNSG